MDVNIVSSVDKKGRKICKLEYEKNHCTFTLKNDYSNFKPKLSHRLKDIEDALDSASDSDEFKKLVDISGFLYVDIISD